jgi:hypothetical protein
MVFRKRTFMSIDARTRKILWAKAGNRCSYRYAGEVCNEELVITDGKDVTLIGNECHIIGEKPKAARYLPHYEGRNSYDNLILMCPKHHKIIDANEKKYTAQVLREMKKAHEKTITERLTSRKLSELFIKESVFRTE